MMTPLLKSSLLHLSDLNQPCTESKLNLSNIIYNVFEILKSVILPNILIFLHSVINLPASSSTLFYETSSYFDIENTLMPIFFLIISVTKDSGFFVVKVYCANIGSKMNFSISLGLHKHNCEDNRKMIHCLKFNVNILHLYKKISEF